MHRLASLYNIKRDPICVVYMGHTEKITGTKFSKQSYEGAFHGRALTDPCS